MKLDASYWQDRWENSNTPWDIGYASPAIIQFVESKVSKDAKILIPGCGNAYEAEALMERGFTNVNIIDISPSAIEAFKKRVPEFPEEQILCADFFQLEAEDYDVVIEQTFFCALDPVQREAYVRKMHEILKNDGLLTGLLFNVPLNTDHPPFGGSKTEYIPLFNSHFHILEMEVSKLSIKPRLGNELFICLKKI
jgi:SAM-dependent methyltransferase